MKYLDLDFDYPPPEPDTEGRRYIEELTEAELSQATTGAQSLLEWGAPAKCTVIIPVAAKQEAHNVDRSVGCYDHQETTQPFTVVLGLNADVPEDDRSVQATLQAVERAKQRYPSLDLRSLYSHHPAGTTIGGIRRGLWNSVLLAGLESRVIRSNSDMLGINHDIDTIHLPRRYMKKVQNFAKRPPEMTSPTYTEMRHAADPRTPNISRYLYWSDFLHRKLEVGYEASAAIPMRDYADLGGFDPNKRTHEVGSFLQHRVRGALLKTGPIQTSPRRFQARLAQVGTENIWTEESFEQQRDLREADFKPVDISDERLEVAVRELDYLLPVYAEQMRGLNPTTIALEKDSASSDIDRLVSYRQAYERALRIRKQVAQRTLAYCVGLPDLVPELVDSHMPDEFIGLFARQQASWELLQLGFSRQDPA